MIDYDGTTDIDEFRDEFNPLGRYGINYKGGSSSAPETTTQISKTEPPDYVKPYSIQMMTSAGQLAKKPYESYPGDRIAGLTPQHYAGLDMTTKRAFQGSPAMNAATEHTANVFDDAYMNKGLDMASQVNPYQGQANPYSGSNQYMEGMIDKANQNITDNYRDVVSPGLDAMGRNSGAFGNTGVQATRNKSQEQLLQQLSDTENQYRFQDYGQQAQLAESGINRNAQLASQQQANTLGMYSNERQAQGQALEFAPAIAANDYTDYQMMLGAGDILRNAEQQQLDYGFDQWQQQQNYPYQQLNVLQGAVANSMGGQTNNITSAPNAYGQSSTAQNIGLGLSGVGAVQGLLG